MTVEQKIGQPTYDGLEGPEIAAAKQQSSHTSPAETPYSVLAWSTNEWPL